MMLAIGSSKDCDHVIYWSNSRPHPILRLAQALNLEPPAKLLAFVLE
jgi:hypothetical protein